MKCIVNVTLTLSFLFASSVALACEVCQKQQPKVLRGVVHGAGPQSDWDYVVVGGMALIALVSLVYAVRWMIRPGEKNSDHIKRSIFQYE